MSLYERLSTSHGGRRNKLMLSGCLAFLFIMLFSTKMSSAKRYIYPPTSHISRPATINACNDTLYQEACVSALVSSTTSVLQKTPMELFDLSVQFSKGRAQSARALAVRALAHSLSSQMNPKGRAHLVIGMNDCIELLDHSLDRLSNVLNRDKTGFQVDDVQTWLSAALTNQATCMESLQDYKFEVDKGMVVGAAQNLSHFISISLALYMSANTKGVKKNSNLGGGGGRRLLSDRFPDWLSMPERKLLEASTEEIGVKVVVAKDGSGTHMSISEALASLAGDGRSVIYVKAGTYSENLQIPASKKNVMLVGDGKGKTVIVGSRNSKDGWTTYKSATVSAIGDGFMARDITIMNSAGPAKHQAVALLVGSDKSVIYRCSIIGYQDTLFTHSQRQFYAETDIYGTVDFIFGNSAVVFQNCNIYPRKPMSGQKNFITAQGRADPNENTGISIINCKITATSDLAPAKSQVKTFLGRPWQAYSRTVIMESFLDDSIHPQGWAPWSGNFALKSLFYGEYMNSGPGSSTSGRVQWPGYHASLATTEAEKFTVGGFISGNQWLPATGVPFDAGLHA
ncbi:pectinesterase-like [Cornus florida]|uniref:pectinesterase-like n=1 Tax=Cornus florida TaxID=4283 RepID=UPI00289D5702|nr:pectinesterase-like [Cornus florida]